MFVGWGGATDGTGTIEEQAEEMLSETMRFASKAVYRRC